MALRPPLGLPSVRKYCTCHCDPCSTSCQSLPSMSWLQDTDSFTYGNCNTMPVSSGRSTSISSCRCRQGSRSRSAARCVLLHLQAKHCRLPKGLRGTSLPTTSAPAVPSRLYAISPKASHPSSRQVPGNSRHYLASLSRAQVQCCKHACIPDLHASLGSCRTKTSSLSTSAQCPRSQCYGTRVSPRSLRSLKGTSIGTVLELPHRVGPLGGRRARPPLLPRQRSAVHLSLSTAAVHCNHSCTHDRLST